MAVMQLTELQPNAQSGTKKEHKEKWQIKADEGVESQNKTRQNQGRKHLIIFLKKKTDQKVSFKGLDR